jgi:hypothetical protein
MLLKLVLLIDFVYNHIIWHFLGTDNFDFSHQSEIGMAKNGGEPFVGKF